MLVPSLLLRRDSVALLDPKGVKVRLATSIARAQPAGITSTVAGLAVPVMNTPMAEMADRHDYPNRPAAARPLVIVK